MASLRNRPVQVAKARFSELFVACERQGTRIVTRRGGAAAALAPIEEWRRLSARAAPGLEDLSPSDEAGTDDLAIPPRKRIAPRKSSTRH